MIDDILSSLQTTIVVPTIPSTTPTTGGGYGQYRKNIENCCSAADDASSCSTSPSPSPSPLPPAADILKPPKRRHRNKDRNMTMMLANIKL